ncbi:enoyl-CoA hydratase/isomerase family protein [Paraburkholderia sp. HP33-1]|uniref:enoyl-CoA hydratase/isomerase family protein n=1 Tax=Paraburkholderia sp. HP33-1 TaxID=2883243 RepID=UPI001F3A9A20|nr:enoyl-CoA hydratase/isomerase family protein [Paraburkholderia sp. HP33-1]
MIVSVLDNSLACEGLTLLQNSELKEGHCSLSRRPQAMVLRAPIPVLPERIFVIANQVTYDVARRIATNTLNRPETRNALSPDLISELIQLVRAADRNASVKCILLRGEGDHFCGGGDVRSFQQPLSLPPDERYEIFERRLMVGNRLLQVLREFRLTSGWSALAVSG